MNNQEINSNRLLDSAIAEKLKLSYEQRIEAHQKALELTNELKLAGEELRARSKQVKSHHAKFASKTS